jgi:hypothetical protein
MVSALAAGAILLTMLCRVRPYLIWNLSESAPVGLYRVQAVGKLNVGDLVIRDVPGRGQSSSEWSAASQADAGTFRPDREPQRPSNHRRQHRHGHRSLTGP